MLHFDKIFIIDIIIIMVLFLTGGYGVFRPDGHFCSCGLFLEQPAAADFAVFSAIISTFSERRNNCSGIFLIDFSRVSGATPTTALIRFLIFDHRLF
jgi:hypothetical protein